MHALQRNAADGKLALGRPTALLLHLKSMTHLVEQVDPQPAADACRYLLRRRNVLQVARGRRDHFGLRVTCSFTVALG